MSGRIVVVGSLNMDLVVRAPHHPRPGETVLGGDFRTFPGGKGANQAVAAARLGGQVALVGRVGQDAFGQTLLAELRQDGVDVADVASLDSSPSGIALITLDAAGQNTIVVAPGANAQLSPADITAVAPRFVGAALLVAQLECPLPTVARAIELAHEHGLPVLLNPAPARSLDDALLALVDYLVPNETELRQLAGGAADEPIEQLAMQLHRRHGCRLVVTLGAAGALLVADGSPTRLPAYPVDVVDTTAAGDAFIGGLAAALADGQSLERAARLGMAAGAITVTRAGAQPALPYRHELARLLEV